MDCGNWLKYSPLRIIFTVYPYSIQHLLWQIENHQLWEDKLYTFTTSFQKVKDFHCISQIDVCNNLMRAPTAYMNLSNLFSAKKQYNINSRNKEMKAIDNSITKVKIDV